MVALSVRNAIVGFAIAAFTGHAANAAVLNFTSSFTQNLAGGTVENASLTGSWTTNIPVTGSPGHLSPDGSFTKSDLSDFSADLEIDLTFVGVSDVFKTKYHYDFGDLTSWSVTIAGGEPVAYDWVTGQIAPVYENIPAFINPAILPTSGVLELTSVLAVDGLDDTVQFFTFGGPNGNHFLAATFEPDSNLTSDNIVPEPAALALFGMGLAGLAAPRRKR